MLNLYFININVNILFIFPLLVRSLCQEVWGGGFLPFCCQVHAKFTSNSLPPLKHLEHQCKNVPPTFPYGGLDWINNFKILRSSFFLLSKILVRITINEKYWELKAYWFALICICNSRALNHFYCAFLPKQSVLA